MSKRSIITVVAVVAGLAAVVWWIKKKSAGTSNIPPSGTPGSTPVLTPPLE